LKYLKLESPLRREERVCLSEKRHFCCTVIQHV
jgi:hypothetical protein